MYVYVCVGVRARMFMYVCMCARICASVHLSFFLKVAVCSGYLLIFFVSFIDVCLRCDSCVQRQSVCDNTD
jgi:hypothetical protein